MTTLSAAFNPSLDLLVTDEQRERSLSYLQHAYAEGRLTELELDERIGMVLNASNRREMNQAFTGLARIPVSTAATVWRPRTSGPSTVGRMSAAVTHFSGLGTSVVGPVVAYAVAPRDSYLRKEAAKAFNFQLLALVAVMVGGLLDLPGMVMAAGALAWFVLTLVGAARAAGGEDWRNPVTAMVPLRVLDEGPRRPRRRALGR